MSSLSRQQIVKWLKTISIKDDIVLDVGCGPRRYWIDKFTNGEPAILHTLDINEEFNPTYKLDMNRELLPGMIWQATPKTNHYDKIFSIETFEHLWNPVQAIRNIWNWLKDNGEFFFSTPFINPIHDTHDFLRMTDEWWETALEHLDFEVDYIKPRIATKGLVELTSFYKKEGLRMSKIRIKDGQGHRIKEIGYYGRAIKNG